jgi:hypothetical protein
MQNLAFLSALAMQKLLGPKGHHSATGTEGLVS